MLSFSARPPGGAPNPLDGCVYLYLDMGTNIGVQIRCPPLPGRCRRVVVIVDCFRKLFEPEKFPRAPVKDVFKKYFFNSNNSRDIQPSEVT